MSKKSKLPDHSPKVYDVLPTFFPAEAVSNLAAKYPFSEDFDLQAELDSVLEVHSSVEERCKDAPTLAGSRRLLENFVERLSSTHDCMSKFGDTEISIVNEYYLKLVGYSPDWEAFDEQLQHFQIAAETGVLTIPKSQGGRKKDLIEHLARWLYRVFTTGTGCRERVHYSDSCDGFPQDIVQFVSECMATLGVDQSKCTNIAVGNRIKRFQDKLLENIPQEYT